MHYYVKDEQYKWLFLRVHLLMSAARQKSCSLDYVSFHGKLAQIKCCMTLTKPTPQIVNRKHCAENSV